MYSHAIYLPCFLFLLLVSSSSHSFLLQLHSVCRGSGDRSGPTVPCRTIKWGKAWKCQDCPLVCTIPTTPQPPSPPSPPSVHSLHPFSAHGAGDVNGPFEHNGTYHLFKCCDWAHLISDSAVGPWQEIAPGSIGLGYISGSVTVVDNVPRVVAPLNRGNNQQCCVGPPSNGTWNYPCVANPPTPACQQTYMMSVALDPTDVEFKTWQQLPQQTVLVNYTEGHAGTGYNITCPVNSRAKCSLRAFFFVGVFVFSSIFGFFS